MAPGILAVGDIGRARALVAELVPLKPLFACTIAYTETCRIPGLSAAGAAPHLLPLTPAADAETLRYGRALCLPGVPCNPLGPPGPVLISLAALRLAHVPCVVVDAGCQLRPQVELIQLGSTPGASIEAGRAVPHADRLFRDGLELGRELARQAPYLVLAESVPGGTTTALAVLLGLGFPAEGRLSSSLAGNPHQLKDQVARKALRAAGLDPGGARAMDVLSRVGDPMQAAVCGMLLGAAPHVPVLLGGGTQMIAVLAAAQRLAFEEGLACPWDRIGIATTRWVAHDPNADFAGLMGELGDFPALVADLRFHGSRCPELRRYEDFLVKEGVGAGAAAVVAFLAGVGHDPLLREIESSYLALSAPGQNGAT